MLYYIRSMFNWKTYRSVGVKGVDMCAAAILAHRQKSLPLKAIHMWPGLYKEVLGWVEKQLGRELMPDEKMEFDGVYIEQGTRSQLTPLILEMWVDDRPVTDFQKWAKSKMGIA